MAWPIILAGISAASGAFNAFDEFNSNRQIRRELEKIKHYLIDLKRVTNEIKRQNDEILKKLDALPDRLGEIVQEIVNESLLRERYSSIEDIRDQFIVLNEGMGYNIRDNEWLRFSDAMHYLFTYEYRISRVFDLINVCEIALIITKERAMPIVILRLDKRIDVLRQLKNVLQQSIESALEKLKVDLDNQSFVLSHNLSRNLNNINLLSITKQPDRLMTEHYTVRVCTRGGGGGGREGNATGPVCSHEPRSRQVPDAAFHSQRDKHIVNVDVQVFEIKKQLYELGNLSALLSSFEKYRARVSEQTFIDSLANVGPMYFFEDENSSKNLKATEVDIDWSDFDDYNNAWSATILTNKLTQDNRVFYRSAH